MIMELIQRVRKTDLARNTRQVINAVLRGQTAVIESHGQPEVAIIDIVDYRILRAVMHYYARQPQIDVDAGLSDQEVATLSDLQDRYDLVMAGYLAGAISLARAAELLDLPWLDLRHRCLRLDVPLRTSPVDLAEANMDVEVATTWAPMSRP
jgi:predicted HTH domain antitoxin